MAAYAATTTINEKCSIPLMGGGPLRILTGTVTLSNYNATLAEITGITKFFKRPASVTVLTPAMSSNGYWASWVGASKALKVWKGDYSETVDGPAVECGNDVNVGTITFVAIGV